MVAKNTTTIVSIGSTDPFIVGINHVSSHTINNTTANQHSTHADTDNTILALQNIPSTSGSMDTLFDNASTRCLILDATAKRLQLKGEQVVIGLTTVNKDECIHSTLYTLKLIDGSNTEHNVKAFGVPKISGAVGVVDFSELKKLFSQETDLSEKSSSSLEVITLGSILRTMNASTMLKS